MKKAKSMPPLVKDSTSIIFANIGRGCINPTQVHGSFIGVGDIQTVGTNVRPRAIRRIESNANICIILVVRLVEFDAGVFIPFRDKVSDFLFLTVCAVEEMVF